MDKDMEKMMGNALHYQLIRTLVIREQNDAAHVYQSTKVKRAYGPFEHASDEENRLHAMTDEQLDAYITGNYCLRLVPPLGKTVYMQLFVCLLICLCVRVCACPSICLSFGSVIACSLAGMNC